MVEISKLPTELNSKIVSYLSHQVADIVNENMLDFEDNNLVKDFIFLQQYFPNFTFDEMIKEFKGQNESNWLDELVYRFTYATYRDSYRTLYFRVKDIKQDLTARQFNDIIDSIRVENPYMFYHALPNETLNFIQLLLFVSN